MRTTTTMRRMAGCLAVAIVIAGCSGDDDATTNDSEPSAGGETITYSGFLGTTLDAMKEAFIEPFAEENGISVEYVEHDYDELRSMIDSGDLEVDVADADPYIPIGNCGTYAEPLDFTVIDTTDIDPEFVSECAVPAYTYAMMLTYDPDAFETAPTSWADFFDVEKFPGKRGVYGEPTSGSLEIALLADGVAPEDLYPLDVERALAKLDTIRDYIVVYDVASESEPMMVDGTVTMLEGFQARILGARQEGSNFKVVPDGRMVSYETFMVPKGSPHRDLAMKLIAYAVSADGQERFASLVPYGEINNKANPTPLDEEYQDLMIGDDADGAFIQDVDWWAANDDEVVRLWNAWLATLG